MNVSDIDVISHHCFGASRLVGKHHQMSNRRRAKFSKQCVKVMLL